MYLTSRVDLSLGGNVFGIDPLRATYRSELLVEDLLGIR